MLAGVVLAGVVGLGLPTPVHSDGGGPLGSLGQPVTGGMSVDPSSGDTAWTFGVPLCLASGDTPAVLVDVRPTNVDGDGFRYVGSGVRTFRWTEDEAPLISVGGWPPPAEFVPGTVSPVSGYEVSRPCVHRAGQPYTELLLGFERVGSQGGGWRGMYVDYTVGGAERVLEIDHHMLICGATISCEIPDDAAAP